MIESLLHRKANDADVKRIAQLLGLNEDAFCRDDNDRRREVFLSLDTADVVACPGSGKTTLLVAKLASLIEQWKSPIRGMCVLSHTNKAGDEIAEKLCKTPHGHRLLSYPHYVGTIHGFVNQFIAMPWMRSLGYEIQCVDTDIALSQRWGGLTRNTKGVLTDRKSGLPKKDALRIHAADFQLKTIPWGRGTLGDQSATYKEIQNVCRCSLASGFCTYEDTFTWARDMLEKRPDICSAIRHRFPILLIDEAQDTSEEQAALLHSIFSDGEGAVIRQRFGDPNQAIFQSINGKVSTTDPFPSDDLRIDIQSSYRFSPAIAKVAASLECLPHNPKMEGLGPMRIPENGVREIKPQMLVFDDEHIPKLLEVYGNIICDQFTSKECDVGVFYAVGQTHKPKPEDKPEHHPKHVAHYYESYDPQIARRSSTRVSLLDYLRRARLQHASSGELHGAVGSIAEGIWRLAKVGHAEVVVPRMRHHRRLVESISGHDESINNYHQMIIDVLIGDVQLDTKYWIERVVLICQQVAKLLVGGGLEDEVFAEFCAWSDTEPAQPAHVVEAKRPNMYLHERDDGQSVEIQLGSIHSVKGMTHTATLVLETHWYDHNLAKLLPISVGKKKIGTQVRQVTRSKVHYVAMTRPSHLLCVAVQRKDFDKIKNATRLANDAGWEIVDVAQYCAQPRN